MSAPPIPLRDQIACVAREVALRRNVYRGFVASGRPRNALRRFALRDGSLRDKADEAERELTRMEAVLATLQDLELGAANEPGRCKGNAREGGPR